jgi:catechol 2,3-dioxygenase-like lactoylglutathione lyase family enzyme
VLTSPHAAVVGSSDPDATRVYLEALGFAAVTSAPLPAETCSALYGIDRTLVETLLAVPGAAAGAIRVVETPHPAEPAGPPGGPYAPGPTAIDLYTTDIDASAEAAAAAGARVGPVCRYTAGPIELGELRAVGPDGLAVVFIEIAHRHPSILDAAPDRLHSEVHSVVWTVPDLEQALGFWRGEAGLVPMSSFTIADPAITDLLELPEDTPITLHVLADADRTPARFELLQYLRDEPAAAPGHQPLHGGLHAAAWLVDDLDAAVASMPSAMFGPVAEAVAGVLGGPGRAVAGTAPGGVRFELWEVPRG